MVIFLMIFLRMLLVQFIIGVFELNKVEVNKLESINFWLQIFEEKFVDEVRKFDLNFYRDEVEEDVVIVENEVDK